MRKKLAKLLAVLTFLGATGIFYSCDKQSQQPKVFDTKESTAQAATSKPAKSNNANEESTSSTDAANKEIYVYVCGQVKKPGVYTLKPGERVTQAIKKAGGFTKDAYSEGINLAKTVSDEEQLYVPSKKEAKDNGTQGQTTNETKQSNGSSKNDGKTTGKININTASKEELKSLPGVGDAKAANIISYRETNGSFAKIEDLMKITGIKSGVFTKIKDYITVE